MNDHSETEVRREIIITASFVGFHSWPTAPEVVAFLRNRHRHLFRVRVGIPVLHGDRQREFFIEKANLMSVLEMLVDQNMSCEMYAETILHKIPHALWAEVWEDGENGARVTFQYRGH